MSSARHQDTVTLGVQAGDKASDAATNPHYMPLRKLLREYCAGPYSDAIDEFAIVLRIDGSIWHWDFEGFDKLRLSRKGRFITVDIGVPRYRWENCNASAIRTYLVDCVEEAIKQMIALLVEKRIAIESDKFLSDFKNVRAQYMEAA